MTGGNAAISLEMLLRDGGDCHDEESERLAHDLETAAEGEVAPGLLVPFVQLLTHTIGEHLGDWPRALKLGRRVLNGRTATAETAKAWMKLYVAAVLVGDALAAVDLELSCLKAAGGEFGAALLDMRFMLVSALVNAKRTGEAARLYRGALSLAEKFPESAQLDRSIAVTSNNLGWELYEMSSRSTDEDVLMQLSARTSLAYWLKCGNWINTERAHYLNAVVANVSGEHASGLGHADAALAIIAAQGERPLDTALLHLARAAALAALGDDEGKARAISDADASSAKLTEPELHAKFAAERARISGTLP